MGLNQGSFTLGRNTGGILTRYFQEVKITQKFTGKPLKNQEILAKDLAQHKTLIKA